MSKHGRSSALGCSDRRNKQSARPISNQRCPDRLKRSVATTHLHAPSVGPLPIGRTLGLPTSLRSICAACVRARTSADLSDARSACAALDTTSNQAATLETAWVRVLSRAHDRVRCGRSRVRGARHGRPAGVRRVSPELHGRLAPRCRCPGVPGHEAPRAPTRCVPSSERPSVAATRPPRGSGLIAT